MRRLIILCLLLCVAKSSYAHGSSHYICKSERVGVDRIDHCTSYDQPQPDKYFKGYYTEEQIQERIELQKQAWWVFGSLLVVTLGVVGWIIILITRTI